MNPAPALSSIPASALGVDAAGLAENVADLQSRIRGMQRTRIDSRGLPTLPGIADLLGEELRAGVVYSVSGSTTLALAMLAGPSRAGSWCGVVGVPSFGIEAAAAWGIDLDRLVLVPRPAEQWLQVTAAMADVMAVVLTRPPAGCSPAEVARLGSRLRQRGATMITLGDWPQSEATLAATENRWHGLGRPVRDGYDSGHGYLTARQLTVRVEGRRFAGRSKTRQVWLPDSSHEVGLGEQVRVLRGDGLAVVG